MHESWLIFRKLDRKAQLTGIIHAGILVFENDDGRLTIDDSGNRRNGVGSAVAGSVD